MGYKITKRWRFLPFCGPQEAIDEVPKKLGQYFMTKDGRAVYFDIDNETRIRLSGEGGGGGDPVITTPLTSQVEIGNVKVGKTYPTGTYLETIIRIVPLKVGMYRYQHHGAGSLSVYMNRRDFA